MHAVVGWCVEDELDRLPQLSDRLGMNPELVDKVQAADKGQKQRVKSKQGERNAKDEHSGECARPALPQRRGKIVVLR